MKHVVYNIRGGSNEVSFEVSLDLKKNRNGCALPGANIQKPYAPKFDKGKTKPG
jgi:hypothetical protein